MLENHKNSPISNKKQFQAAGPPGDLVYDVEFVGVWSHGRM